MEAAWTGALPSHSPGIPKLADRVAQGLYAQIAAGKINRLDAIYSRWQPGQGTRIERKHLLPFEMDAFAAPKSGSSSTNANPPMLYLPPGDVVQALTADYMMAELCRAGLHGFAAENEARMEAMAAARGQIERQLAALQAAQRRVRQTPSTGGKAKGPAPGPSWGRHALGVLRTTAPDPILFVRRRALAASR